MTLLLTRRSILTCTNCNLSSSCRRPVPFSGDPPSPYVIVGEAPGEEEDAKGKPFIGSAGRYLRSVLDAYDGPVSDTFAYVNAVCCYPKRTPSSREVDACRGNLDAQLSLLRPVDVLFLGGVSVSGFVKVRIGELRGRWFSIVYPGRDNAVRAYATWHPSAALRAGKDSPLDKEFVDDLREWAGVIMGDREPSDNRTCVKCRREVEVWDDNKLGWCREHGASIAKVGGRKRKAAKRPASVDTVQQGLL